MRDVVLIMAALVFAQASHAQTASSDSDAIVALEFELSRLLAAGRVAEYATHLTSDYARTTRQGTLEGREAALASWRARGPSAAIAPTDLWVRVYGDAAVLTAVLPGTAGRPGTRITKTFVRQQGRWLLAALCGSGGSQP